jgi:hypothetical protein
MGNFILCVDGGKFLKSVTFFCLYFECGLKIDHSWHGFEPLALKSGPDFFPGFPSMEILWILAPCSVKLSKIGHCCFDCE